MDVETLQKQIERLGDIEAIKNMQADYTYKIDAKQFDQVEELLTEDIEAEFFPMGKFGSRKELMAVLRGMAETSVMMRHLVMNPYIEVEGDTAKGRWYLFGPFTSKTKDGDIPTLLQGQYNNEYKKIDGVWKISKLHFTFTFQTPYADGWVKTPMLAP